MNRFFTLMLIPEKTKQVKRLVIPSWVIHGGLIILTLFFVLAIMMTLDYWYVLSRLSENKELQIENRKLKQQLQVYKSQIYSIQDTMDRVENFANRLRVITTSIEDRQQKLPQPPSGGDSTTPAPLAPPQTTPIQENSSFSPPQLNTLSTSNEIKKTPKNKSYLQLIEQSSPYTDEKLIALLKDFAGSSNVLEESLLDLYESLADKKDFLAAYPTLKPAPGRLSSKFDVRENPYLRRVRMHEGIDIANHPGTPIFATAHGVITFAGPKAGYGYTVIIEHGYGIQTLYAHNSKVLVKQGELIRRGEKIALMGSTGHSTGPHVHYEIRIYDIPVDPEAYILEF